MAVLYDAKVIFSGHVYEVILHGNTMAAGFTRKASEVKQQKRKLVDYDTGEILEELDSGLENRQISNIRARNTLRRLITTNFTRHSKFLTLTFHENLQDIEEANKVFKRFIISMNRYLERSNKPKLKYAAVIEFQKRGAIHYHVVCNLKGVGTRTINKYWQAAIKNIRGDLAGEKLGSANIKNIRHVDNVGAYLVKYMTKQGADERLIGKKLYRTSQRLKKPTEIAFATWKETDRKKLDELIQGKKIAFLSRYTNKYTGSESVVLEINKERQ